MLWYHNLVNQIPIPQRWVYFITSAQKEVLVMKYTIYIQPIAYNPRVKNAASKLHVALNLPHLHKQPAPHTSPTQYYMNGRPMACAHAYRVIQITPASRASRRRGWRARLTRIPTVHSAKKLILANGKTALLSFDSPVCHNQPSSL